MIEMIVVNTCISQERFRYTLGTDFFRVAQHPTGLPGESDSLIISENF